MRTIKLFMMTDSNSKGSMVKRIITALMAAAIMASACPAVISSADAATVASSQDQQALTEEQKENEETQKEEEKVEIAKVKMKSEVKYNNDTTHPYGKQTNTITLRWNGVENAERYQIYIKGGKYKKWTKYKTVFSSVTEYDVKKLSRNTAYQFKVRGIAAGVKGPFSSVQKISTARMDFDKAGWQAMCRIVYHEVGGINDKMWNEPIVHVSDCVVNRYEAAKYLDDGVWAPYYRRYNSVQSVIYSSGGFMSDSGLARDGATYAKCTSTVKSAVYGALYDKVTVDSIKHDHNIFYWSNTGYKVNSSKVAYSYRIPWGYFNIWSEYWG